MMTYTESRDFLVFQLRQLNAMQFLATIYHADLTDWAESRYNMICEYMGEVAKCVTISLFPDAKLDEYGLVQIGEARFALLSQRWWETVEFELGEKFGTLE